MQYKYTKDFLLFLNNKNKIRSLITNNGISSGDFKLWLQMRSFTAQLFNHSGSVLDIGCANGFYLKCLQQWASSQLDFYGIDDKSFLIEQAQELFPNLKNNFKITSVRNFPYEGLPTGFDFIFWNIWDDWDLLQNNNQDLFNKILEMVNPSGRLILVFYNQNKEFNIQKIEKLKQYKINYTGVLENGENMSEIAVWYDKIN